MYKKYIIDLTNNDYKKLEDECDFSKEANSEVEFLNGFFSETKKFGSINAIDKMDQLFPIKSYDVFISHSHNDMNKAKILKNYLKLKYGLNVFIDSDYWESSDAYLKELDNEYCKIGPDNYSYEKRNLTTSHVHVMLSISIMKIIEATEVVFFLSTKDFAGSVNESGFNDVRSPWIFLEAYTSKLLQPINKRLIFQFRDSGKALDEQAKIDIRYDVKFEDIEKLNILTFNKWSLLFLINRNTDHQAKHPLDILYQIKL